MAGEHCEMIKDLIKKKYFLNFNYARIGALF